MKSRVLVTAVGVLALAMTASGGVAFAGEKGETGNWAWYYEGAVETGSIAEAPPAGVVFSGAPGADVEEFPVVEAGGVPYRVGVDTR